jgi:hypothetical protein
MEHRKADGEKFHTDEEQVEALKGLGQSEEGRCRRASPI